MANEKLEQREFLGGQLDVLARASHAVRAQVDFQIANRDGLGQRCWPAPGQSMNSRHELTKGKWFREVVVSTGVESFDAIVNGIARRQHEHRRSDAALPD